jgi:NAD(P)-dependent dehydrogenase (short-subunit alcohol dehydrogenase family)
MSLFDLTGKVALITGSTKGIGRSIAEHMAAHSAKVVISSRRADACDDVASAIRKDGGEAFAAPADISKMDQVKALVDRVLAHWGRIDILVCNAAVNSHYGPLLTIPDEAFDKSVNGNLRSVVVMCNAVLPQMAERKDGAVILVGSIAGLRGSATIGFYSALKAAEMSLARCLAVEWGAHNIRVNSLSPGLIRTDMSKVRWSDPERLAHSVRITALGRIGEPEDLAGAAVFLASNAGRYVTGQNLSVDGGATITGG